MEVTVSYATTAMSREQKSAAELIDAMSHRPTAPTASGREPRI
jgi:hypothetical protein